MKKIIYSYLFFLLFFNSQYSLADTISRIEDETLMAECKHFKDRKIALLREIEIDKCANQKGKDINSSR